MESNIIHEKDICIYIYIYNGFRRSDNENEYVVYQIVHALQGIDEPGVLFCRAKQFNPHDRLCFDQYSPRHDFCIRCLFQVP